MTIVSHRRVHFRKQPLMGPRLYFSSCVIIYEVRNSLIVSQPVNLAAMMDGGRKLYYWKRRQSMRCGTKTNASPSACHRFINVMLHLGSLQWTPKFNWKANRQKDFPLLDSLEYARQIGTDIKILNCIGPLFTQGNNCVCRREEK